MTIVPFLYKVNNLILNPLILLAFGISFVYFIFGVVRYLSMDAADKNRKTAQDAIIWGVVGMLIMFSVYGIIGFILSSFGIDPATDASLKDAGQFIGR